MVVENSAVRNILKLGDLMKRDEIINLTGKWLNSIDEIRNRIKFIDNELKQNAYSDNQKEKLKSERYDINKKLTKIINAISTLKDEDQKIICLKYFEKMKPRDIGLNLGYSEKTIFRKSKNNKLIIGRVLFGFEDEFWNN